MWYLYILKSEKDGIHYVGISKDVSKRLREHNAGRNRFTKGHIPWKVIYTEEYKNSLEARRREKYFKSGAGRRFVKEKIEGVLGSPPARQRLAVGRGAQACQPEDGWTTKQQRV